MKKEALFAIIIGIIVGLGITYAIYHFRQVLVPTPTITDELTASPISSAEPAVNEKIMITSPENEAVLETTSTTISGTTDSNQMVIVFVNDTEYITQADDIGAFAVEVELENGSNVITITSVAADGQQYKNEIVVVVSTASLDNTQPEPVDQSATPSATAQP